ncbi:WxL domain-containing protein [Listeria rocourtiae]|nr:WxL domain-containing protein [Listeria rocourtiae]
MTEFRLGTGTSGYTGIHMLINAQNGLNGRFRTLRASRWGVGIITNDAFSIVQLPFSDPEFYGLTEDDEDTARYMFEMELPKQFSKEKYPEDLVIDIDLNSISKKVDTSEIKIIDKNSKEDLTAYFELSADEYGVKAKIDRSNLSEISSFNMIQLQIEAPVDLTHPDLMNYFNAQTGYLTIPATAKVDFSEETFPAEAEVKLRKPFADGVKQTVAIDSGTADLNPEEVIENIWSPIENDTIQVVGFKDEMVFSELGETEITVIIRSETTGLESEISVPVIVVTGELKFSSKPDQISFGTIPIQSAEKEYFATDFDEDLTVGDTRYKKDWKVTVQLIGGLSLEGSNTILHDAMYYTNTDGEKTLLSVIPTSVKRVAQNAEQSTVISDSWKSGQNGISIKPRQGQVKSGKYSALLIWMLEDTP